MGATKTKKKFDPLSRFISLEDAAKAGGVTRERLLEAASKGELPLVFECRPEQVVLLPSEREALRFSVIGIAETLRSPEFLELRPELCNLLRSKPHVQVFDAFCGYRTSGYMGNQRPQDYQFSSLQRLNPTDSGLNEFCKVEVVGDFVPNPSRITWARWGFASVNSTTSHSVGWGDLLIIVSDFYRWMEWEGAEGLDDEVFLGPTYEDRDDGYDFKSPQLLKMCEAAFKLWGNEKVIPEDSDTHPSNTAVVQWLLDSGVEFTKTSAENAASLIKPAFANKAGAPSKKN